MTYQTINGWEATAWAAEIVESDTLGVRKENLAFSIYKDALFDQAINDLGINRVRLQVKPGLENTVDYFPEYLAGQITFQQLNKYRHNPVNDDADPLTINAEGFKFAELDHKIETVVKPLRDRLKVRGELLHINLKYVSDDRPSTFQHASPAEYAEFMLAVFQHMQAKYGFVPNTVEPVLEPDLSGADWTPTKIGQVVAAAGARLEASGFTPKFGVPSTTDANRAPSWFDGAAAVPGARQYFGEVVYHRYKAPSSATLQAIAQRGAQVGGAAQLELIGATYVELHEDLKFGNNTAWSQYVLAGPVGGDRGGKYYFVDESNPKAPVLQLGSRTKFLRQYFRYIRRGAVRVEATTSSNSFDPVAFRNADDRYVVVVKAARGGSFQIVGLPAGSYELSHTTSAGSEVMEQDVNLGSGQVLTARIPGAGVITVYEKSD